jgi:hypothetical protein
VSEGKKEAMRNAEALRRIADRIEQTPEIYKQESWFLYPEDDDWVSIWEKAEADEVDILFPDCGTHACIAGHAIIDAGYGYVADGGYYTNREQTEEFYGEAPLAAFLLGLTTQEARLLFLRSMRPREGMTAPEMLRALADGARVSEVIEVSYTNSRDYWVLVKEENETLA